MGFHQILCPTDFSPGAHRAMATAIQLANEHDAELVLFHAWYVPPIAMSAELGMLVDAQELADAARAGLDAACAEARQLGVRRVRGRLAEGQPWQRIVEAAGSEPGIDLIVLGSHGRTGLRRVLLGSVAESVVRHAPCPVLTVRGDGEPRPFRHVLCPVDFSPRSRDAVELAIQMVQPGGAGLVLLHVLELPITWGELRPLDVYPDLDKRGAALLDDWVKDVASKVSVPVRSSVRVGSAGAQLLGALDAADPAFDLVVIGSHGRTGLARMALGSVAEKIVRHAHCPVLVVHRA